jgi:hypothetical protein
MQDYINKEALLALGLELSDEQVEKLVAQLNNTVEERVGEEIVESLNDDELDELVKLQENADDQVLGEWIAKHVPEYEQIVSDAVDMTLGELAESAENSN